MKTWKSKKIFGSCIWSSFVYISCAFFSVSSIYHTYEKNPLNGLHNFKSFLSFRCLFVPGAIKRRTTRFVCISCPLLYTLLFAYLSFLFLIRPSARSSYFYLRNSWVRREKLTFTISCFLFLIHVVLLVLSPFLFFLFLFGLNRV